jgi:peptidoglycan/LPS O-acetylase OafA/YrhL
MFFALSGFLVAGSLARCKTLVSFLGLRVLRIVPALAAEVFLSGIILGSLFTTLPLRRYFLSWGLVKYFLNIVGDVQFSLPGVFYSNPHPGVVNQQLWTVPWELDCYILLAALALVGIVRKPIVLVGTIVVICIAALLNDLFDPPQLWVNVHGIILVESFIVGVAFFCFRTAIKVSGAIFILSLAATMALLFVPYGTDFPYGDYFVACPAAYVTVYLGLLNPARDKILLSGDYSYGIYLYGFPIQQAVSAAAPSLRSVTFCLLVALPLTVAFAAGSWWLVEKRALRLRRWLPAVEAYLLNRGEKLLGSRIANTLVLDRVSLNRATSKSQAIHVLPAVQSTVDAGDGARA